mgnify:CR=1 FL=1
MPKIYWKIANTYFINSDTNELKNENLFKRRILGLTSYYGDIERLISKIATTKVNPREVIQLKNSLEAIVPIKALATNSDNEALKIIGEHIQSCDILRERIKETLNEDAPVNILKGNTISSDFSSELKELRELAFSGKDYLDKAARAYFQAKDFEDERYWHIMRTNTDSGHLINQLANGSK